MSNEQNVTAFLRQKRDYFHIILTYQNDDESIMKLSFSTSLKVRGNKKKAEMLMQKIRVGFVIPHTDEQLEMEKKRMKLIIKKFLAESDTLEKVTPLTKSTKIEQKITKEQKPKGLHKDMLFSSYLVYWLEYVEKYTIDPNTYSTYRMNIVSKIAPYFENKVSTLSNLTITDIQEYYTQCIDGYKIGKKEYKPIKPATVKRRHANIRKALQYAVDINLIPKNPADSVDLPKIEKYVSSIYTKEEIDKLFDIVRGTKLEVPVTLAAFYGLRREEAIGLRWDAIDFEKKRITINHTVTEFMKDGKLRRNTKDSAKNTSSLRTFPLVEPIEKILKRKKQENQIQRKLCGKNYSTEYLDYVNVDEFGKLIKPGYISKTFKKVLAKNNLRHIRYHDLRHSCATLLYDDGRDLKEIQVWLGHSTITTTANIYTHFDYSRKTISANSMLEAFNNLR